MPDARSGLSLAIAGGKPAFTNPLHVGQPNIGDGSKLQEMLAEILERRWLTNHGPVVQQFEQRIESMLEVKHCVAVCNATIGLQLLVRALGLYGEVIVPSFTFSASAQALAWCGLTPVFCDVEPEYHTIDAAKIEPLINENTSGILGVHLWGNACNVDKLGAVGKSHGLKVMYDSAHAFGCAMGGKRIGNFGDAEVFSFHATKYVNSFEGGVVTTNSDELAEKLRLTCNFGFKNGQVECLGTNAKMSEISAAMGIVSLDAVETFSAVNLRNRNLYAQNLRAIDGIRLVPVSEDEFHNRQYIVIEIDEAVTNLSRDQLLSVLHAENVLARRYFHPGCHEIEPFVSDLPDVTDRLPVTLRLCDTVLALPTGTGVSLESVDRVCEIIRTAVEHADLISSL